MCAYFSKLLKTHFLLSKYFAAISVASSVQDIVVHKGAPAPLPFLRHPPSLPSFFKIFASLPLLSVPPPFKVFQTVSPSSQATPSGSNLKNFNKNFMAPFYR